MLRVTLLVVGITGCNGTDLNVLSPYDLAGMDASGNLDASRAPDGGAPGTWNVFPNEITTDLYAVWGSSSTDVFAVGGSPGAGGVPNPGVILHWDGVSFGGSPSGLSLLGISGSGSTAIGVGVYSGGLAIYENGGTWSNTPDPLFSGWARGVAVEAFGAYAVGDNGALMFTTEPGVAGSWSSQSSGVTSALYGVWGVSPGMTYAVGAAGWIVSGSSASVTTPSPG